MWNTVLFDLDGTLTDSGEGITKCVDYALRKGFGIETADLHELDCFVGPPLKEMFMEYAGLSAEDGDRAVALYRESYTVSGIYENRVYDGIRELLETLAENRFTIALASSKPEIFCRSILRYFGLEDYFTVIAGSTLDGKHTAKSEVLEEALRLTGMSGRRSEVVLVGDRRYDVDGAKEAGTGSIAVTYGYGSTGELEASGPDCICDTPKEVENVLLGQAAQAPFRTGSALPPYAGITQNGSEVRDLRVTGSALPGDGPVPARIWKCIWPFIADLVFSAALSALLATVISVIYNITGRSADSGIMLRHVVLITGITDAVLLVFFRYIMIKDDERRRAYGYSAFRIPVPESFSIKKAVAVAVSAVLMSGAVELAVGLLVHSDPEYDSVAAMIAAPSLLVQVIVVGIVGPIMEEVLFRGLIYRRLRDYTGVMWAMILSSALFGLAHGNLTQGVFAGIFGMILAMYYEHYGSLWACCTAHMANNIFSIVSVAFLQRVAGGLWLLLYAGGAVLILVTVRHMLRPGRTVNVL